MNNQQTTEFNRLFGRGTERMKDIVVLGDYKPSRIGYFKKIKVKKSIKDLEKCLALIPDHWQSMFFIGKAYQRLGDHSTALDFFEKAMDMEPDNYSIPQEASLECVHLGNIEKALEYSEKAIISKPNDSALLGNLAVNLLIAHKDEEARQAIDNAIKLDPDDQINKNVKKMVEDVSNGKRQRPTCKMVFKSFL